MKTPIFLRFTFSADSRKATQRYGLTFPLSSENDAKIVATIQYLTERLVLRSQERQDIQVSTMILYNDITSKVPIDSYEAQLSVLPRAQGPMFGSKHL